MTQREEEPDPERPLSLREELARAVVDRGQVVGVERVPQAERVGEGAEPRDHRMGARVVEDEPPAGEMEEHDGASEPSEPPPLFAGERVANPGHRHIFAPAREADQRKVREEFL